MRSTQASQRAGSAGYYGPCRHKDKSTGPTSPGTSRSESVPSSPEPKRAKTLRLPAPRKDAFYPGHVRACANNSLDGGFWALHCWKKDAPGSSVRVPYTCGSYRCPSEECRRHAAHVDFARINEAMTRPGLSADGWVFIVLTLDRNGTFTGGRQPWKNEQEAFSDLSRLSQGFLRNLRKAQRARCWRPTKNEWVATVESHRSGWPHLNLAIYSPELAAELRRDAETLSELGVSKREVQLVRGWLQRLVTADVSMGRKVMVRTAEGIEPRKVVASWGVESTAEAARNKEALASYIIKLSAEGVQVDSRGTSRTVGEVAKLCQAPSNARMKLRRIRAGKGFLPPRHHNDEWTGVLLRWQRRKLGPVGATEGDWECNPAHDPLKVKGTTAEYVSAVGVAAQNELALLLGVEAQAVAKYHAGETRRVEWEPMRFPVRFHGRQRLRDGPATPDPDDPMGGFLVRASESAQARAG